MRKTKIIITLLIAIICIIIMPIKSNATNEDLVIVKQTEEEYIIYLKQYLNQEFEFAYSNNSQEEEESLVFIPSALDSAEEGANSIAYVDSKTLSMFANPTYMWIKVKGELKISAREINLHDNITKENLEAIGTTSKIIPITIEQEQIVNEVNEEGTKITETVGVAKISPEITEVKYQIIQRKATENTEKLYALAELIEKNEFTDKYTGIKANKEYFELYNSEINNLIEENWKIVENSKIAQPIDAKTGDQYILYVKTGNTLDVHYLTSYREYDEQIVKEQITTLLPHTYDNNTILVVLGITIVAIILVITRIIILKKKEMK